MIDRSETAPQRPLGRRRALRRAALAAALALAACAHGPGPKEREAAQIHNDLALEALGKGNTQEALRQFEMALKLDDTMPEAHLGRGIALEFGFADAAGAETEYRRAIQLRPNYSEAHNDLGQLLAKTGRLPAALGEFNLALGNMYYREPWIARCNKGETLYQLGRRDEGVTELKNCLSVNPRYCNGHRQLGRIFLNEGRAPEAVEQLGSYAKDCPQIPDAHYQLGLAYVKSGDADKARGAFEKCEALAKEGDLAHECRKSRELLQ